MVSRLLIAASVVGAFATLANSSRASTTYNARPAATAEISDCSVRQPSSTISDADRQIDPTVNTFDRARLRDIISALPATRGVHDVAFFDGTRLYVNHQRFSSTVRVWTPVASNSNVYRSNRGELVPFPIDLPDFNAPTPGDGGARNRYSNVGYSWNCAFIDTTQMTASAKPGVDGELGYIYEGGYTGISGNSYTSSTDAGLQVEPNHPGGGNIVAYLLEKPGTQNRRKAITGGDFAYNTVFRVTAHYFVGKSGTGYVDTTVEGMKADGSGVGTTDIALIADSAWNASGSATVVKRVTSIGQTIPGACGATSSQCRQDGSYLTNIHWSDAYVGTNNGSSRLPWTSAQGNGFLCVPNDSRVQVAYVNPASETDSITLTAPAKRPCTR